MAPADRLTPSIAGKRRPSRPPRSPSVARSTGSKRSPSPIISALSDNPKGVKNITRKVIKRLEGLGHLEMVDSDCFLREEEDEFHEENDKNAVKQVLYVVGQRPTPNGTGANGRHVSSIKNTKKIDFEIPRKVLHSSIGLFTLYFYVSKQNVDTVIKSLWLALCFLLPAELLRFRWHRFERFYEHVVGFLMRESEKTSINGVVWYILGVNFALSFYPQDVATVAILILSWADTAASTFGRLYGAYTPKLPARLPILRLPMAPRKSLAGFLAATLTGASIASFFWGFVAPLRDSAGSQLTWSWEGGVQQGMVDGAAKSLGAGGAVGLLMITVVSGLVSGIAEALELGSLDDNLTLPIISGGCILGFLKLLGMAASWIAS